MSEPRLVDDIREEATDVAASLGLDPVKAQQLAGELVRRIAGKWGGERHYVHNINTRERARQIAADPRHPKVVAKEHGVSVKTVIRVRSRRLISSGIR